MIMALGLRPLVARNIIGVLFYWMRNMNNNYDVFFVEEV